MTESLFISMLGSIVLLCLVNWRVGIYGIVLMDLARDPFRKLSESQSIMYTVVSSVVWLAVFIAAVTQQPTETGRLFRLPGMRRCLVCMVLAILPGAVISFVSSGSGWIIALLGAASYLGPIVGITIGYLHIANIRQFHHFIRFYVLANAVFLIGGVLEYNNSQIPGLGGIGMNWIRNYGAMTIKLISGFYRSADIMGLHAASVCVLAIILALWGGRRLRTGYLAVAFWGAFNGFISGRRKMMAIPIVFVIAYLLFDIYYLRRIRSNVINFLVAVGALIGIVLVLYEEHHAINQYRDYALSTIPESIERIQKALTSNMYYTYMQSGWLGSGLGSATQGQRYMGMQLRNAWQEDGLSRLMKELGIPGLILALLAAWHLVRAMLAAVRVIPHHHPILSLQVQLFCFVLGNVASFVIAHQHFSGDPMSALFVAYFVGAILGMPQHVDKIPVRPIAWRPAMMRDQRVLVPA